MDEELKVIVFTLADEKYGIEIKRVKGIERVMPVTRVPNTYDFIKGVINLRGVVIPVIDLRGRFGLPVEAYTHNARTIIVEVNDIEVGVIVDSANDVVDIDINHIEDPPEIIGGIKAKYLRGIAKMDENRFVVLLNLEKVLNNCELIQFNH
ncbi:purine-binding chemotaxis protein CheW [Paenibacillus taihuensis]|uniref:Purine-binding chemotaxis protein CheW n=1 Tax=Paenibacillus taihuensis TaxID=1156355 RepID=A0A3D9RHB1_9BACL|nr:chemotaxis protein CheW [Paenibacillus taihuensis]REE77727.1 purine-binding chemotaxis protein CheW [Paenibacillus taihuensis]